VNHAANLQGCDEIQLLDSAFVSIKHLGSCQHLDMLIAFWFTFLNHEPLQGDPEEKGKPSF